MKSIIVLIFFIFNCFLAQANDKNFDKLDQSVVEHVSSLEDENYRWQSQIKQDIAKVKHDELQLLQRLKEKQAQLALLNQQTKKLVEQKKVLTKQYRLAVEDMQLVEGAYKKTLNNLSQLWQSSPTQLLSPNRNSSLSAAGIIGGFPRRDALNTLIEYAIADIQFTGKISSDLAYLSLSDGQIKQQAVRVFGGVMAVAEDQSGFVSINDNIARLVLPTDSAISEQLSLWLTGDSLLLPVDLSQGQLLPTLTQEHSVKLWVQQGGEVLWPILILAALGFVLACWRATRLFRWHKLVSITSLGTSVSNAQVSDWLATQIRAPAASVLADVLKYDVDADAMDQRLKQSMLAQMSQFERGLGFIALLAAMAPMLGLLGTVSGMIETFQSLTEFGNSDPKLLSQGISKALITTQAGLLVALPLLLLHYPLKQRAQALSINMEEQAALLLALKIARGREDAC
ncbi:MAG: MotA/TolQ/ExbB proton channel family protein [Shewanella sp.]